MLFFKAGDETQQEERQPGSKNGASDRDHQCLRKRVGDDLRADRNSKSCQSQTYENYGGAGDKLFCVHFFSFFIVFIHTRMYVNLTKKYTYTFRPVIRISAKDSALAFSENWSGAVNHN